jgi:hypothetical protein
VDVGWNVAMRNTWIVFSQLLYCFGFVQVLIFSAIDFTKILGCTLNIPPQTRGCTLIIKPRNEAHRELILRECPSANDNRPKKSSGTSPCTEGTYIDVGGIFIN